MNGPSDTNSPAVSLGTLGGPETFAGQAAAHLRRCYPYLGKPLYFADGATLFEALHTRQVAAIVAAAASVNGYAELDRMLGTRESGLYVIAECELPFACALLGKPGTRIAEITQIFAGPVSVAQARPYLERHLRDVPIQINSNPLATAQRVAASDGTQVMLGTRALAKRFALEVLASDVDGGAEGNWWALSSSAVFDPLPERVFVTGRFQHDGKLGRCVVALSAAGFTLTAMSAEPTGGELLEFDCVLRFRGSGTLAAVRAAIASVPSVRFAGAIRAPSIGH